MDIAYLKRQSKFLDPCIEAIRNQRQELASGKVIRVALRDAGGFEGAVKVAIRSKDELSFGTDWINNDATFFPARLKAAATALRDCGLEGDFIIEHKLGEITISQIGLTHSK
jgi:hypothetical protein